MEVGLTIFPTDSAIRPDELARAAEDRGFESLFFSEHTHIPVSRRTPYPAGGDMPQEFAHIHDPFIALSTAAASTRRIRLGTGICTVTQRDPIILAKQVASLDVLSGGRVILGVGAGWNAEEMENHSTAFTTRWQVLQERIEAMKCIWRDDEASYNGEFVRFDPIWCYPKPLQSPHPPILLGAHGGVALRRVVAYCDGWLPVAQHPDDLGKRISELRRYAGEAGRDPSSVSVSVYWARPEPRAVEEYAQQGVDRMVVALPTAGRETVLPLLDAYEVLVRTAAGTS
ncbi:LLM class F420-dependent oxidoreductase [Streptomyces formicae]|uniref:LLM class F420-dependent oxidoreductase n=1 Tax=Streptomyces formicae TaxID=1616117 RepID=A0ABY3WKD8_9ACTN|nr:LLM class F420-dependent oxidoreductase [Streptomyces formicae]UNM11812.1 LLM class F420-dependent oxidoreductase [Streptomyces formicae]